VESNDGYLRNKKFAARYLGVSIATLDRMVMSGRGPRFVKVGNQIKFQPEELAAFVVANSRGGQPTAPAPVGRQLPRTTP
jgi:excisionase family DNA binding protein